MAFQKLNTATGMRRRTAIWKVPMQDDIHDNFDRALDAPVWGAKAIAVIINQTPRQVYRLLEKRLIDADRLGRKWRSTRRRLLQPGDKTPKTPRPGGAS